MATEKYVLYCRRCGPVEGYLGEELADEQHDEHGVLEADALIEFDTFDTDAGPVTRLRCPRCGEWADADSARQE